MESCTTVSRGYKQPTLGQRGMCLAIPGRVDSIEGRTATVDFGGVKREAVIDLMEAGSVKVGTWVLVHTGFVIQVLDEKEALETLELWKEVLDNAEEIGPG